MNGITLCGMAMGLFSRRTKTAAADFTRDFYDRFVFGVDPSGREFAVAHAEVARRMIAEVDASFAAYSFPKLVDELLPLRLEMVGTAWTHQSKLDAALAVSEFTKCYLTDIGRSDLWEAMTDYNQAIAQSVTYGADRETRMGRARLVFINKMRADLFDDYFAKGFDAEAVARVVNRTGSEVNWKAGTALGLLAIQLARRLDLEGSPPIWERLGGVASGFYQEAMEALEAVKLTA